MSWTRSVLSGGGGNRSLCQRVLSCSNTTTTKQTTTTSQRRQIIDNHQRLSSSLSKAWNQRRAHQRSLTVTNAISTTTSLLYPPRDASPALWTQQALFHHAPSTIHHDGSDLNKTRPSTTPLTRIENSSCCSSLLLRSPSSLVTSAAAKWQDDQRRAHSSSSSSNKNDPKSVNPSNATDKNETNEEEQTTTTTSDPPVLTWVDQYLPTSWQPYARLARIDKPIGTWLLLWPCAWSTAVAGPAGGLPDPALLTLFAVGAFTMRGAGCTINDMWDRDVDRAVTRTTTRPLAAGDVTMTQAWGFLALQLTTGLAVLLSLPHTWYCFQWGAASLPLVAIYPTMKRFFPYPQLVLGLTFNWGAWMGWAATYGSMDYSIIAPLYLSGVSWTLLYDTIYAHQDKTDDAKLGLQSTALTFGSDENQQRMILHGLALATASQWAMVGMQADLSSIYYAGVAASYSHLAWQVQTAEFDNPHNVMARFRSNSTVGAMLFVSLAAGKYLA